MTDIAARNKRNKQKGTAWESAIEAALREAGWDAERLRLNGREDEGDLILKGWNGSNYHRVVVEAKSGAMHPAEFVREAVAEARNFEKHRGLSAGAVTGIAIVKQRGKGVLDGYVLSSVREFFGL